MAKSTFHIVMYPWFAIGHLTPFLHLSSKLAKKGHKISFFIPKNTMQKLEHFNRVPELITFVPITVPHVDGLPPEAETTSDVPSSLYPLIMTAMDRTENEIEVLLRDIKPDFVFFDFTHWMPRLTRQLGIKSILYCIISSATISYGISPARLLPVGKVLSEDDFMQPPPGYPNTSMKLHKHEAHNFGAMTLSKHGNDMRFCDRPYIGLCQSDAIAFRTCREIEGPYIDYLEAQFGKPVLLSGPVIPESSTTALEDKWTQWLGKFKQNSVIYCAFGTECILSKDKFQELLLGLELTGLPFLAALKPPVGVSMEEAMPKGFEERVEGKGMVYGGWVPQMMILEHRSVGCFVTHCGYGSLTEALLSKCQLVLLPHVGDQFIHARMLSNNLKVGVEVEKEEDSGFFTRENVCMAVRIFMDEDNKVGREVRDNHAKIRELMLKENLESSYIDNFCETLKNLLEH